MKGIKFVLLCMILIVLVLAVSGGGSVSAAVVNVSDSNNTSQIQAALDGASDGDVINFSAGTYSDVYLMINKPLTLVANTGDYRTSGVVFSGESGMNVNKSNISVRGFRFENVNGSSHESVVQLSGHPYNISNFVFEKNKFFNTTKRGITSSSTHFSNLSIADNHFEGIGFNGDRNDPNNVMTALFLYGVVNSTIRDNVINGTTFQGINLGKHGTSNVMILDNSISNTPKSGIQIFSAMDSNVTIRENEIRRTNMDLTRFYKECHRREQNRAIRADGGASRDIFNVIEVSSDSLFRSHDQDETTACYSGNTPSNNHTVVRTLAHNVEAGIMIDGASGVTIWNNVITDNHNGIVICPSYCAISNHSYQFNSYGALNESAGAVITAGNIIHSNEGRDAIGYNHFTDLNIMTGYNLVYGGSKSIRATRNDWGSSYNPSSTFSTGDFGTIKYLPWTFYHNLKSDVTKLNLTSGENVFNLNVRDCNIPARLAWLSCNRSYEFKMNVTMDLSGNVSYARMLAVNFASKPRNTGEVSSSTRVYRWLEISDNIDDSLVRGADITFIVPKSWLDSNELNEDDVVLLRHDDGDWDELETDVVSENSDDVVFSAESPGFSFFAIAGILPVAEDDDDDDGGSRRSSGSSSQPNVTRESSEKNKTRVSEKNETKDETDREKPNPQPVPAEEVVSVSFWNWFLWVLVAVVVLVVVVVLLKKKKGKN